eukprot:CAMPEP_0118933464 /NCGR_PEP_ID=MMETSP1169-20130426/12001_1 /TAXON_ID=36882 /ORGANISM="Pyramimonas obovata, Strain CCMP722" /LENGTH=510 /DNA_ID=CAMNT_0006876225 /DNA_START=214 /DNA_END=1742 /DNA_ORIENTATION=+
MRFRPCKVPCLILNQDFSVGKEIGKGSSANIHEGTLLRGVGDYEQGTKVAVKVLDLGASARVDALIELYNARQVRSQGRHPNIVELIGTCLIADETCYLLMENIPRTLAQHLSKVDRLTMADLCDFSKQILRGLEHIKHCGLVHRDVKCENILVSRVDNDDRVILKIADLGSAQNNIKMEFTSLVSGTLKYMAPEMLAVNNNNDPWRSRRRSNVNIPLITRLAEYATRGTSSSNPAKRPDSTNGDGDEHLEPPKRKSSRLETVVQKVRQMTLSSSCELRDELSEDSFTIYMGSRSSRSSSPFSCSGSSDDETRAPCTDRSPAPRTSLQLARDLSLLRGAQQHIFSEKVDVYGLGMIMYQIVAGMPPYADLQGPQVYHTVLRKKCHPRLTLLDLPPMLELILRLCIHHQVELRPTLKRVRRLLHRFEALLDQHLIQQDLSIFYPNHQRKDMAVPDSSAYIGSSYHSNISVGGFHHSNISADGSHHSQTGPDPSYIASPFDHSPLPPSMDPP